MAFQNICERENESWEQLVIFFLFHFILHIYQNYGHFSSIFSSDFAFSAARLRSHIFLKVACNFFSPLYQYFSHQNYGRFSSFFLQISPFPRQGSDSIYFWKKLIIFSLFLLYFFVTLWLLFSFFIRFLLFHSKIQVLFSYPFLHSVHRACPRNRHSPARLYNFHNLLLFSNFRLFSVISVFISSTLRGAIWSTGRGMIWRDFSNFLHSDHFLVTFFFISVFISSTLRGAIWSTGRGSIWRDFLIFFFTRVIFKWFFLHFYLHFIDLQRCDKNCWSWYYLEVLFQPFPSLR